MKTTRSKRLPDVGNLRVVFQVEAMRRWMGQRVLLVGAGRAGGSRRYFFADSAAGRGLRRATLRSAVDWITSAGSYGRNPTIPDHYGWMSLLCDIRDAGWPREPKRPVVTVDRS